jgi:hypothetical protein
MAACVVALLYLPFFPMSTLTYDQISAALPELIHEPLKSQNINTCKKNFDFTSIAKDGFVYYLNEDAMDVEEVVVIRVQKDQHDEIIAKFQQRIDEQKQKFDGYGVIQMEKLNQAKIMTFDDVCILIVSNDEKLLTLGGLI